MTRILTSLTLLAFLAACGDGQPFFDTEGNVVGSGGDGAIDGDGEGNGDGGDGDGVNGDVAVPPGTDDARRDESIVRFEARNSLGGGYAESFAYNAATDEFTVDNLAFDGLSTYQRSPTNANLGSYRLYAADETVADSLTGNPVIQVVPYRAVLGFSQNAIENGEARTNFALVRTGYYNNYGFGGYIYERNEGTVLQTTGQAAFDGRYAGIRVYNNRFGMDLVQARIQIAIDFDDFNANDTIKGIIYEREAFDVNGAPAAGVLLPDLFLEITEGESSLNGTGEISGVAGSDIDVGNSETEPYETGEFYGIIAGDMTDPADGGEIVGMIVVESKDRRFEEVTAQETGGFIVYR